MDGFEWNKYAAGGLLAAITILVAIIVTGEVYKPHVPEERAYAIEGVEAEATDTGGAAVAQGPSVAELLQTASAEKGATVFKKCATCHTIEKGGANKTGPNLWGVLGSNHAHQAGFGYSDALASKKGEVWTWEAMDAWLANPRAAIPGNKMSFAGLSKPEERAALLAYLNQNSDKQLPLPTPPAKTAEAAPAAGAAGAAGAEQSQAADVQQAAGAEKIPGAEAAAAKPDTAATPVTQAAKPAQPATNGR